MSARVVPRIFAILSARAWGGSGGGESQGIGEYARYNQLNMGIYETYTKRLKKRERGGPRP